MLELISLEDLEQKKLYENLEYESYGLVSIKPEDLEVVDFYYQNDRIKSKRSKQVVKAIQKLMKWNLPEKDRKWFHF